MLGSTTISDFKIYCRTLVIKTALYWHKNRHTNLWLVLFWNRIKEVEINPHNYNYVILDKMTKNIP
jgi:hypothetical protein